VRQETAVVAVACVAILLPLLCICMHQDAIAASVDVNDQLDSLCTLLKPETRFDDECLRTAHEKNSNSD
jgi:hypothetical protein